MNDNPVPENTNPMLENLLADAEGIGIEQAAREYAGEIAGHFDNDPVADFGQPAVEQIRRLVDLILRPTPEQITAEVLDDVRGELDLYEDNAEDGTTIQDAATDVVQHLHNLYGVMPIPQDAERTWFTCVDCDSGDMTEDAARWHESHEGHVVEEIDDEEEQD